MSASTKAKTKQGTAPPRPPRKSNPSVQNTVGDLSNPAPTTDAPPIPSFPSTVPPPIPSFPPTDPPTDPPLPTSGIVLQYYKQNEKAINVFINTQGTHGWRKYKSKSKKIRTRLFETRLREFNRTIRARRRILLTRVGFNGEDNDETGVHLTKKRIAHIRILLARAADALMHESRLGDQQQIQVVTVNGNSETYPVYQILQELEPFIWPGLPDLVNVLKTGLYIAHVALNESLKDSLGEYKEMSHTITNIMSNIQTMTHILQEHEHPTSEEGNDENEKK